MNVEDKEKHMENILEQYVQADLKKIYDLIDSNVQYLPDILSHVSKRLREYAQHCEKHNDSLLRNALGDAVTMLSRKRKPTDKLIRQFSVLIKKAIYKDGLTDYHHQGEKDFYNRFIKEEDK